VAITDNLELIEALKDRVVVPDKRYSIQET